jgi:hypothetical protein
MNARTLLWDIECPPLDLDEICDKISSVDRMEFIKRLVCSSDEDFDMEELHAWLGKFIEGN